MGRQAGSGPRSDMRHPENAHLLKAFKRERGSVLQFGKITLVAVWRMGLEVVTLEAGN